MEEEHYINDLYEDMERLNALYEELMWPHDVDLCLLYTSPSPRDRG